MIATFLPRLQAWLSPKATMAMSAWSPLVGGRLELGNTGFVIKLRTDPKEPPYLLTDPDGRDLALGFLLQPLKEYGEQHARDRREFEQ